MPARSRHDHYPRTDTVRCGRLRSAADGLEARWRADDAQPDGIAAAFDAVAGMSPGTAVAALMPWLVETGWLGARLDAALALMAADPFARPPLRPVGGGGGAGGLILAGRGAVRLSLQIHPAGVAAPPATLFIPGWSAIHVLVCGGATLHRHDVAVSAAEAAGAFSAAGASRSSSAIPRPLQTGETWAYDSARTAFTLSDVRADVLLLELAAQPPSPLPIRSYDVASGRLLHVSASRRGSSFRQMALTLLRSFGRTDAAPLFAAETQAEDFAARWSALREYVALDPAAARPHVERMAADDPHPEIRRAAAATLALYAPKEPAPCLA